MRYRLVSASLLLIAGVVAPALATSSNAGTTPTANTAVTSIENCAGATDCIAAVESTLANEAAGSSFTASHSSDVAGAGVLNIPTVYGDPLTLPGDIGVTVWHPCTITLHSYSSYYKPTGFTDQETAKDWTSTNCPSYAISSFSIYAYVYDYGVQPLSSTHSDSNSGSSTSGAQASAEAVQGVSIYSFPTDYHAYGSRLQWAYHLHIAYTSRGKGPADLCISDHATYPGGISGGPSNCP